jgi:hypothetical protein
MGSFFFFFDISAQEKGGGGRRTRISDLHFIKCGPNRLSYLLGAATWVVNIQLMLC